MQTHYNVTGIQGTVIRWVPDFSSVAQFD